MNAPSAWPTDFSHVSDETLEKAQRAFEAFYPQCFWWMKQNLQVSRENLGSIIKGLKEYGGHQGYRIAASLCR